MQSPAVVLIPFDWVPAGVRVVSSQRTDARSRRLSTDEVSRAE